MIAADWTVALGGSWKALVRGCVRYRDADITALNRVSPASNLFSESTNLAVIKVLPQTLSSSTYAAVWTVVDLLFTVVVPQLTDVTIVARSFRLAVVADLRRSLRRATDHAQHVLRHLPV